MKIDFLEGYKNGFNNEDNSISLRIIMGPLKQYLNEVINNKKIYNIMSGLTEKYKSITFSHIFCLYHPNRETNSIITNCQGALYITSNNFEANGDNLQEQLQKSLMSLFDELTDYGEMNMIGKHYINIMIKNNEKIIDLEYNERIIIKKNTRGYMFNDDDDDDKNSRPTIQSKKKHTWVHVH